MDKESHGESIEFNAKRLRSREAGMDHDEQKPSKYITTLRDKVPGTPRRKVASRKSLRPDWGKDVGVSTTDATSFELGGTREKTNGTPRRRLAPRKSLRNRRSSMASATDERNPGTAKTRDENPFTVPLSKDAVSELPVDEFVYLEALEEEQVDKVEWDPVQPVEGPQSENIDEALHSPLFNEPIEEDIGKSINSPPPCEPIEENTAEDSNSPLLHENMNEDAPYIESADVPSQGQMNADEHGKEVMPEIVVPATCEDGPNDLPTNAMEVDSAAGVTLSSKEVWPTSLVNASQDGKTDSFKDSTTNVKDDDLGNSEIAIQPVGDADAMKSDITMNTESTDTKIQPFTAEEQQAPKRGDTNKLSPAQSANPRPNVRRSSRCVSGKKEAAMNEVAVDTETASTTVNENASEGGMSQGAVPMSVDVDQVHTDSTSTKTSGNDEEPTLDQDPERESHEEVLEADNDTGEAEIPEDATIKQPALQDIDPGTQASPAVEEKCIKLDVADPDVQSNGHPQTKTRSGTRFSDDTSMLKDFLSRAQARKLAKDAAPKANLPGPTPSPRRSSRKAPTNLDGSSPTRQPRDLANRPGTPPDKVELDRVHLEEAVEATAEASPVRRSTRKRLPELAKTASGAPSFIPVRRADGTDPVKLQKSVAQELALVTQTNTRRNKGQSKPPAIILKTLTLEHYEEATKGGHALRNCKTVGWDKKLVYYHDGTEAIVDVESKPEEKRPKARRLRGLGAGNGTPAPKKTTTDVLNSNGTRSSKRHGRTQ